MFQALNAHHQEANCIDAASGIVLSERTLNLCTELPLTERTIPDAASMQLAS